MATLTVTIKEEINLNGSERGLTNTQDITGVTQLDHRIVKVGTTEQSLVLFGTAEAAGQFADGNVVYLRVTNLDSSNEVTLRIAGASEEYFVKIKPNDSYLLYETLVDANAAGSATVSFANIDEIKAQATTAACNVELFIAS